MGVDAQGEYLAGKCQVCSEAHEYFICQVENLDVKHLKVGS